MGLFDIPAQIEQYRAKRREQMDVHAERQRALYEKFGDSLTAALLEPDESSRQLQVDNLLTGIEGLQGKPVGKPFKAWLNQNPEDAAKVLTEMQSQGLSPQILLRVQDNPLLFAAGLRAISNAKRERGARELRGTDGGGQAPASGAPGPSMGEPLGGGISVPAAGGGTIRQDQPFASAMMGPATPPSTPQVQVTAPAVPQQGQQAAGPAEPQVGYQNPQATIQAELGTLTARIQGLDRRIGGLAGMGRSEQEITPLRQERERLESERRTLVTGPSNAALTAQATSSVQPITDEEAGSAVEAATRAGRPDLARRIRPGMQRSIKDALMSELGHNDANTATARQPTTSGASPYNQPGVNPEAVMSEQGVGAPAAPAVPPRTLVQTRAEKQQEQADITRRSQPLSDALRRDPAVIAAGAKTVGDFEDMKLAGKVQDANLAARDVAAGTGAAQSAVKSLDEAKDSAENSRRLDTYLDVLSGAAMRAGPRGAWVTPVRSVAMNLANVLGVSQPKGQSNLQLMEALSNKLIPELTKQFKGSQSDREFAAGLASAPNIYQTEKGFAAVVWATREIGKINMEYGLQAQKWAAKYGDLDRTDPQGRTFKQVWNQRYDEHNAKYGNLQLRTARALGVSPEDLLKAR